MKVSIASPPIPSSIDFGIYWLERLVKEAAVQEAKIICFPESYIPGYPGMGDKDEDRSQQRLQSALNQVCKIAAENKMGIIVPMDWYFDDRLMNVAFVVAPDGTIQGYQTKNQLDPSEDHFWTAGTERHVFEINRLRFGIVICHEGFRYPETVRWAARNGAHIVFHPHFTGSDTEGAVLKDWANITNPYYERAMMMRALENTIYFASSNYSSKFPESASAIIAPDGSCIVHETYGRTGVIVADLDLSLATGLLAKRFKPELYK